MIAWAACMATIPGGKVPARPLGAILLLLTGSVLAIAAVVRSLLADESLSFAVVAPVVRALFFSLAFFNLLSQCKTLVGDLTVKILSSATLFVIESSQSAPLEPHGSNPPATFRAANSPAPRSD
jgi:hypothetical protein